MIPAQLVITLSNGITAKVCPQKESLQEQRKQTTEIA